MKLQGWEDLGELEKALLEYPEEDSPAPPPAKKTKVSTGSACVTRMQEYTGGELTDALADIREKGFDIGSLVSHVDGRGTRFTVTGAEGSNVTVESSVGETQVSTTHPVEKFLEKFQLATAAPVLVLQQGWPIHYTRQKAYVVHVMKLRILHSLHVAAAAAGTGCESVNVYAKPKRTVHAIGFHNTGSFGSRAQHDDGAGEG